MKVKIVHFKQAKHSFKEKKIILRNFEFVYILGTLIFLHTNINLCKAFMNLLSSDDLDVMLSNRFRCKV